MKRNILISAAVAAVLGTAAAAAMAAGVTANDDNAKHESKQAEAREVAAVVAARTSLAEAIQVAETSSHGRAVAAGAEEQDGTVRYEVVTADGKRVIEWRVDPTTGKVVDSDREDDDDADMRDASVRAKAGTSLADAIAAAQRHVPGKALEAQYDREAGTLIVEVEIVKPDGAVEKVLIDAGSGAVLGSKS